MPQSILLQRIERIFDADLSNNLRHFLVPDIGTDQDELKVVLLVESPYIHEIWYGYPLAGHAGIHVRDVLGMNAGRLLSNKPIGRLVRERSHAVPRLGIMNVSQLPFQNKAYDRVRWEINRLDCRSHTNWDRYIERMEYIKKHPPGPRNYRGPIADEVNQLRDVIVLDFRKRLRHLYRNNPDVLLVCCGEIAQKFYKKARINRIKACIARIACINVADKHDLPHPSRQGWKNLDCQNACLQNIIRRIWRPQAGA